MGPTNATGDAIQLHEDVRETSAPHGVSGSLAPTIVGLVLLCLLYVFFGVWYALSVPGYQSPDEESHLYTIRTIIRDKALVEATGDVLPSYEALQPPIYHVAMTIPLRVAEHRETAGEIKAIRITGVLLGLPSIPLTYAIGMLAVPRSTTRRPWIALGAAAVVALTPQHLAINASVNNDVLSELVVTITIALLLWRLASTKRRWVYHDLTFAALAGVAMLVKATAFPAPVAIVIGLLVAKRREGASWTKSLLTIAMIGAVAFLILAPWLIRNMAVYGDPLGYERHEFLAADVFKAPRWDDVDDPTSRFVGLTFSSFWMRLGYMAFPLPRAFYWGAFVFAGMGATGAIAVYTRQLALTLRHEARSKFAQLSILVWPSLLLAGWLIWFNLTQFFQAQGRYLFPMIGGLAVMFALGLREWFSHRAFPALVFSAIAMLVATNIYALKVIVPRIPIVPLG